MPITDRRCLEPGLPGQGPTLEDRKRGGYQMTKPENEVTAKPIIAGPQSPAINTVGKSLVVREWTDSGPSYMHIHRSDDEARHVLEGSLQFRFPGGEIDAPAGTTVFAPAGLPHTY